MFTNLFTLFTTMDDITIDILEEEGLLGEDYEETSLDKVALVKRRLPVKLGAPKKLANPEALYKWYVSYMSDINIHAIFTADWVGKDAKKIHRQHFRPPTWKGFEAYLFRNGVLTNLDDYRSNKNGSYNDFADICRALENDLFDIKFTGAALNLWDSRIIAKELHLAEAIELSTPLRPILENGKELPK